MLARPWIALALAIAFHAVVFVVGQTDFVASDPLWYANVAHRIAAGAPDAFASPDNHPFVLRIGLTIPLALLYRGFGVTSFISNLPCLLAALGILLVAYAAAPTPRAKLLAMGLGALSAPLLREANGLNVDLPCAALMACTVLCLARRGGPRGAAWIAGAAVATIAGFLVKETALWCGVVWIYALVVDVRADGARANARRFAPGLALGAVLAGGYLALCAHLWGSPLARFQGIQALADGHDWTLVGRPARAWIDRLTWRPALLFATRFQIVLVPALAAAWLVRGPERIWWIATAAFGLLYWFGSTSTVTYSPLPISLRMVLPILPGVLVCAALALDRALDRFAGRRWLAPAMIAFGLAMLPPAVRATHALATRGKPEVDAFALLRREAADPSRRVVLVCGEPRCTWVAPFYFDFAPPPNFSVMFATDFARGPRPEGATVRALVNHNRSPGAHRTDPALDMTGALDAQHLPPLIQHPKVRLYDAGDGTRLWDALHATP